MHTIGPLLLTITSCVSTSSGYALGELYLGWESLTLLRVGLVRFECTNDLLLLGFKE